MKGRLYRARRKDGNQTEIERALRSAGFAVHDAHDLGEGFPDLVAAHTATGVTLLVECKQRGEKLTPAEKKFINAWPGLVTIAYDAQDAVTKCRALVFGVTR